MIGGARHRNAAVPAPSGHSTAQCVQQLRVIAFGLTELSPILLDHFFGDGQVGSCANEVGGI